MNYKKIQAVVKHQFEWEKNYFFLVIFLMIVVKIIFHVMKLHQFLIGVGLAATLVPLFFLKADFKGKEQTFSSKYLLSFPLTRKELFFAQIIVNLFITFPIILWIIFFYDFTDSILFFDTTSTAAFVAINIVILSVTFFNISLFSLARGSSIKMEARESNINAFTMISNIILIMFAGACLALYFEVQHGIKVSFYFSKIIDYIIVILQTKWLGLGIFFLTLIMIPQLKKTSDQDKQSFRKPLNIKKDLLLLGGTATFTALSFWLAVNTTPQIFQGELQSTVYKKDYSKIQNLISSGIDINKPNQFGVTPMMVAVFQGQLDIVKLLESKGAHYDGVLKKKNDKYDGFDIRLMAVTNDDVKLLEYIKDKVPSFNNSNSMKTLYPIHVAAKRCHIKVMDYLISKGADIESKTENGITPIVIAARNNCFESVVSLKEAGARFDIKDSKGKMALNDLGKDPSRELKMFVEKNMRAPASK